MGIPSILYKAKKRNKTITSEFFLCFALVQVQWVVDRYVVGWLTW